MSREREVWSPRQRAAAYAFERIVGLVVAAFGGFLLMSFPDNTPMMVIGSVTCGAGIYAALPSARPFYRRVVVFMERMRGVDSSNGDA